MTDVLICTYRTDAAVIKKVIPGSVPQWVLADVADADSVIAVDCLEPDGFADVRIYKTGRRSRVGTPNAMRRHKKLFEPTRQTKHFPVGFFAGETFPVSAILPQPSTFFATLFLHQGKESRWTRQNGHWFQGKIPVTITLHL